MLFLQFARTLICQGTLAPVTQLVVPTLWAHDAALSLYPLPDLIVIGDTSSGFNASLYDCLVINTVSITISIKRIHEHIIYVCTS